jgi:hypothetical protein
MISQITERRNGRLRLGTAKRMGRTKAESCRSLDVNHLHRTGCLRPGTAGIWQWTRDGERTAWINRRADADRLRLTYRVRESGGDWHDVAERASVSFTPPADMVVRGHISSVRASSTARRADAVSPSFMDPAAIFFAAIVADFPMPARARALWIELSAAQTRSECALAVTQAWPCLSRKGQRVCGDGPTDASPNKSLSRRCMPRKQCGFTSTRSRRLSIDRIAKGAFGSERDEFGCCRNRQRDGTYPFQCAAPRRVVALRRTSMGER